MAWGFFSRCSDGDDSGVMISEWGRCGRGRGRGWVCGVVSFVLCVWLL